MDSTEETKEDVKKEEDNKGEEKRKKIFIFYYTSVCTLSKKHRTAELTSTGLIDFERPCSMPCSQFPQKEFKITRTRTLTWRKLWML